MLTTVGRSTCLTFTNGRGLCLSSLHDIQINPLYDHCSMFRPNSELLGLIQICIVTFRWFIKSCEHLMIISYHRLSEQPPVYSKPKDSQAPSQAASYPAQGAAYYPQHQQGQVGLTSWGSKCSKCSSPQIPMQYAGAGFTPQYTGTTPAYSGQYTQALHCNSNEIKVIYLLFLAGLPRLSQWLPRCLPTNQRL